MPLPPARSRRRWYQFRLRTLFLGMFIVAGLLGAAMWYVRRAEDFHQTAWCKQNLRAIGLNICAYEDSGSKTPLPVHALDAEGRRMHSWRVLMLSHSCGHTSLFEEYHLDERWDSPNNRKIGPSCPAFYQCPADQAGRASDATNYLAVVGPGSAWPETMSADFRHLELKGASQTALLVEVANTGIHWMEPRDLELTQFDPVINGQPRRSISSIHSSGANVLFRDGSARCIPRNTAPEVIRSMLMTSEKGSGVP